MPEDRSQRIGTQANLLATYTCDSGYELIGDDTRRCVNGVWTGEEPTCIGTYTLYYG